MSFNFDERRSDTTVVMNPAALSSSNLIEEYEKLSTKYLQAKVLVDRLEQEAYKLKRNSELSAVREATLNDELQSIAEVHKAELVEVKRKNTAELDELRNRVNDEEQTREHFEAEVERLNAEMRSLEQRLAEKSSVQEKSVKPNEIEIAIDRLQFLENLEIEHIKRLNDVSKLSDLVTNLKMKLSQLKTEFENLKDYYECAKENLRYKTEEYESLKQINETLQEKVTELSSELAAHQNGNVNHNAKGNSLFAEVDDQRQQMRDMLSRQKSEYLWMKKRYEESEREIRRLKRENADIHEQVKECGNMFRKAESDSRKLLAKHAGFLSRENERLKEKLAWTEARLEQTAKENNVTWLDSMLEFCRNETVKLKEEVKTDSMRACIAEHAMEEAQIREAKWRFEALKLRCIIIDRELLLEQHKIPFEPTPKHMKKIVEERFGDYSKEQPNIDLEAAPCSKEFEKEHQQSEATHASAREIVFPNRCSPNSLKSISWNEANAVSVPNQLENTVRPLNIDSIKKEPAVESDENVEIKPDVSTVLENMNDTSSFTTPFDINVTIKQENKENLNVSNICDEHCLATELATLNPKTPQPQFRTLNFSMQRKKEIKQFTQEVANSGTIVNLNASNAENEKTEIPTPPTRIKQKPRKINFTVNRIISKRAE